MTRLKWLLFGFLPLWISHNPLAVAAPAFPPTVSVENHTLFLNGVGSRTATIFKVKVYNAALYLEKKSSNPAEIIQSNELKRIDLFFLRDVDRSKIEGAWKEGLEKNCGTDCETIKAPESQLLEMMSDMKDGDTMAFVFGTHQLDLWVKGSHRGAITGMGGSNAFEKVLLSLWLGANPPNDELKEGMLGLKAP